MLGQQLQTHYQGLIDMANQTIATVQEKQRDASRSFTPIIQDQMRPAYLACEAEAGPGQYKRMKTIMINHVTQYREAMFRAATSNVQQMLDAMCKEVRQQLEEAIAEKHGSIMRDYLAVLIGAEAAQTKGLPRMERLLRAEMVPLLEVVDDAFKVIYEKPPAKPEPAQSEPAEQPPERAASESTWTMSVKNEDVPAALAAQEDSHAEPDDPSDELNDDQDDNQEMQDAPPAEEPAEEQVDEDEKPSLQELEQQGSNLVQADPGATVADDRMFIKPEPGV
ncbi:hypothetical protein B0T21DRAFT_353156 [Apiosordaria backusii]|uniref:DUF7605 domain-containing protein n=1 Tax=Apiosordaria backusii TaxID=314023 RepID=A0AA39ZVD2_9PEZI|nr:hypothetical protein B0T21DRAFT_353156 [Apiosordaria backusii]